MEKNGVKNMSTRFGQLIKQARENRRWTQDDLAERLNVNRGYIGQLEAGTIKMPRPERLQLLEHHLGISREAMLRAAGRLGPAPQIDIMAELRRINAIDDPDTRVQALEDLPEDVQEVIRRLSLDFVRQAIQSRKAE